jgi:TonB family protein
MKSLPSLFSSILGSIPSSVTRLMSSPMTGPVISSRIKPMVVGLLFAGMSGGLCGGAQSTIYVSSDDALKAAVSHPAPDYPPMARQMHISGKVALQVMINREGSVSDVKVLSGNALLTVGLVNAVKKWKFNPFQGPTGEPTSVKASIDIDFKL